VYTLGLNLRANQSTLTSPEFRERKQPHFVVQGRSCSSTMCQRFALSTRSAGTILPRPSTPFRPLLPTSWRAPVPAVPPSHREGGSLLILKVSTRCGFRPWARQMRAHTGFADTDSRRHGAGAPVGGVSWVAGAWSWSRCVASGGRR